MRILWAVCGYLLCFNLEAMDIKKIYKVTLDPKKHYVRQIDKAIYTQMPNHPEHRYLHQTLHPCCKDIPQR